MVSELFTLVNELFLYNKQQHKVKLKQLQTASMMRIVKRPMQLTGNGTYLQKICGFQQMLDLLIGLRLILANQELLINLLYGIGVILVLSLLILKYRVVMVGEKRLKRYMGSHPANSKGSLHEIETSIIFGQKVIISKHFICQCRMVKCKYQI